MFRLIRQVDIPDSPVEAIRHALRNRIVSHPVFHGVGGAFGPLAEHAAIKADALVGIGDALDPGGGLLWSALSQPHTNSSYGVPGFHGVSPDLMRIDYPPCVREVGVFQKSPEWTGGPVALASAREIHSHRMDPGGVLPGGPGR